MANKKILVLGTAARGGIRSVVEAYEQAGFYTAGSYEFIAMHREASLAGRLATAAKALVRVLARLLLGQVALLHMHVSMRGSFWRKALCLIMARVFQVPVVLHMHGSEFAVFYESSGSMAQQLIRQVLNGADAIVVLSESWRGYVSRLTSSRIEVIGNFVLDGLDKARLASEREPLSVLFLGQFGQRKGIYDLLPAFAQVVNAVPGARLYCGGNGEIEQVRAEVQRLGLGEAVRVPGWISGAEKQALLHRCAVFVLPSYNEGLPMALIEAMSFSMALVSTRVGGIPELITDGGNGYLVTPGQQQEIAHALIDVLAAGPERIAVMGRESRTRYEVQFSPEASLGRMRELYASLGVIP